MTDHRLADLAALSSFRWIVEDFTDRERIVADTHAAYAGEIEALKAEFAPDGDAGRVSFSLLEGEAWACTDLRSKPRRLAKQVGEWVDAHADILDDPGAVVAGVAADFPNVARADVLDAAKLAQKEAAAAVPAEDRPAAVFLTSTQVKRRYHISEATLWRWENGQGDGFPAPMRIGRKKLYHLPSLEAWESLRIPS